MKKNCLLVFLLIIFLLGSNISFAKDSPTKDEMVSQEVNYELPYPGLLPDSPLYFLRVIRDETVGFLISDPFKKAEFNLLQADKRLNAGIYLFNKGKISLALSTISKAENYFGEAIDKIGEAKMEGRNIVEMQGKLRNAVKKHKQELDYMIAKENTSFKQNFEKEKERIRVFEERLGN